MYFEFKFVQTGIDFFLFLITILVDFIINLDWKTFKCVIKTLNQYINGKGMCNYSVKIIRQKNIEEVCNKKG